MAVKGIDQTIDLTSQDLGNNFDPVHLHESIDTTYYGAYLGYGHDLQLGRGLDLDLGAEAGLYYAHTDYGGSYDVADPVGLGLGSVTSLSQTLSLSRNQAAVIASLKASLTQDIGFARLGINAQGDWYSYVPQVRYNNSDNGASLGPIGPNVDTSLGSSGAFGYSLGAHVTIPLSH